MKNKFQKLLVVTLISLLTFQLNAQDNSNKKYPYATLEVKPEFANCSGIPCLTKRVSRETSIAIKNDTELSKIIPNKTRLPVIFDISKDGIIENIVVRKSYSLLTEKLENILNKEIILNPGKVDGNEVSTKMSLMLNINPNINNSGKKDKVWLVEMRRNDAKEAIKLRSKERVVKKEIVQRKEIKPSNNSSKIDGMTKNQGLNNFDKKIIGKWGTKEKGRYSKLPKNTLDIVIKGNSIIIHNSYNYYATPKKGEPMTGMRIEGNKFELGDGSTVSLNEDLNILYIKNQFSGTQYYRY